MAQLAACTFPGPASPFRIGHESPIPTVQFPLPSPNGALLAWCPSEPKAPIEGSWDHQARLTWRSAASAPIR